MKRIHMKCKFCKGKLPKNWNVEFHYVCKARKKRKLPTPEVKPDLPMTEVQIEDELNKAGLPLDQFTFISRGRR